MIVDVEERQKENEASAIALGVCFAFTSVIAAAGWYLLLPPVPSSVLPSTLLQYYYSIRCFFILWYKLFRAKIPLGTCGRSKSTIKYNQEV